MLKCVYGGNTICACETDGLPECKYSGTLADRERDKPTTVRFMPRERVPFALSEPEKPLGQNPKDLLGVKKLDLSLVPPIAIAHEAAAFMDGGIEYNPYNWRDNKVMARIYIAAMKRHIADWESGIEETEDTGVHHLGAVRACAGILLDAQMTGNLIDNRSKTSAFGAAMDKLNVWAKARVAKGRYRNVPAAA